MGKKTKDQAAESAEMTKEQKAKRKMMETVAKHLRFKVPTKNAIIKGQKIEYFQGEKAVECLMDSKWTKEPKDKLDSITPWFKNKTNAIDYCIQLLQHKFFIRASKTEVKPKSSVQSGASSSKESESSTLRKRGEKATDSPRAKKGDASDSDAGKKRKKKYRLEIHHQQVFSCDSPDDVYFWQYDPPSHSTYVIGAAVVIGAVALTMQPLWPDSTRAGMWYLSMGVFVLMGAMVSLIVGRWFLFGLGLVVSFGKIKFWIFPNLDNEKLGILDSFKPFFSFEYRDSGRGGKGKKKRKDKDKGATGGEKVSKESEDADKEEEKEEEVGRGGEEEQPEEEKEEGRGGEGEQPEEEEEEEGDIKESEDATEKVENEGSKQTEQIAN